MTYHMQSNLTQEKSSVRVSGCVTSAVAIVSTSVVTDSESATESADSSESVRVRIRESFAAVSDGFGSSVCQSIFTYQVASFKGRV